MVSILLACVVQVGSKQHNNPDSIPNSIHRQIARPTLNLPFDKLILLTLRAVPLHTASQFLFSSQKPWLVAYNELDAADRPPSQRPRGQPLIFVPGDTEGDIITSKVTDATTYACVNVYYSTPLRC